MSFEKFENVLGKENADVALERLEPALGQVTDIEIATGGLVHHVFRMRSDVGSAYLKIRGGSYSEIPSIKTRPELIEHERKALGLFNEKTPEYFPDVIQHDSDLHYMVLSDIMPDGTTIDKKYQQELVTYEDLYCFGQALGDIHARHQDTHNDIRDPDDRSYQASLLRYGLEFYEHPELIAAANEHKDRPTQLLIGDISPKNIYIEDGKVRFCDLENAHQGALPYDQSFALAHVILHQRDASGAITAINTFMDGYSQSGLLVDQNDPLVMTTLQGILLYRLDNPVIPYPLPIGDEQRKSMAKNVFKSLDSGENDLEVIIDYLFKGDA